MIVVKILSRLANRRRVKLSEMEGHDNASSSVVGATLVLGPLMYCHDPDVDQVKEAAPGPFMVSAQETGQPTPMPTKLPTRDVS